MQKELAFQSESDNRKPYVLIHEVKLVVFNVQNFTEKVCSFFSFQLRVTHIKEDNLEESSVKPHPNTKDKHMALEKSGVTALMRNNI